MFPKYIENILKRLLGERKLVQLVLYPYTGCDVHCSHCSDHEKFRNETMSLQLIERVLRQAKWSWYQLVIVVMGGGEPLLSPQIVPLMEMLMASPLVNLVKITTSGFSDCELEKAEKFKQIMQSQNLKKCAIYHSFNLYHDTFHERLKNAIESMLKIQNRCVLKVSMAVDRDNAEVSLRKLEDVLKYLDLGESYEAFPFVMGKSVFDKDVAEMQFHTIKLFEGGYDIDERLPFMPQWYGIKSENKTMMVQVQPFPVQCFGRGKNFKEKLFGYEKCQSFVNAVDDVSHVYLGPDGECYPDMNCFNVSHMRMGNVYDDTLSVLLRKKKKISEVLVKEVLQHCREGLSICEVHQDICRRNMK